MPVNELFVTETVPIRSAPPPLLDRARLPENDELLIVIEALVELTRIAPPFEAVLPVKVDPLMVTDDRLLA